MLPPGAWASGLGPRVELGQRLRRVQDTIDPAPRRVRPSCTHSVQPTEVENRNLRVLVPHPDPAESGYQDGR
jgi:hypothetical protein